MPEGESPEAHHRQAVYLSDLGPLGVDQYGPADDLLLEMTADTVRTPDLGVDGPLDVLGADGFPARLPSPVIGLLDQVADGAHMAG